MMAEIEKCGTTSKSTSYTIQMFFGIGDHLQESFELLTCIIIAVRAVLEILLFSAFSYLAYLAVPNVTVTIRSTAVAVNIRRFGVDVILLRPELGYFRSFLVVVILCCNECIAFAANQTAKSRHLTHFFSLVLTV